MFVRLLGGPKYSFTAHGPDEFLEPMGLADKIAHAQFAVGVSSFGRSQLLMRCPLADWDKVKVVHCGIERSFYQQAHQAEPDRLRLVCVGRLCEAKGQLLLLQAAAQLASEGARFTIVLAGDGPMRPEIEKEIVRLGLDRHVRVPGWISSERVRSEILRARALVLPSFAEGLPVVLMEAMALRRPVITTYIAGIPELVRDGENGWLIPAGAVDELREALQACFHADDRELDRMGANAFASVTRRHDIDVEARKLASLIQAGAVSPS